MKVWTTIPGTINSGWVDIQLGQTVTIYRCSSFSNNVWGESAKLVRTTKQHLVFITESGSTVKTDIRNLFRVIGKARKAGYSVTLKPVEQFEQITNFHHERVKFWNDSKCCFEFK